jgi:hypothetical protein
LITTPYGFVESVGWLRKFFFGPSRANSIDSPFPPYEMRFEKVQDPRTYAFFGDIMSLSKRHLQWDGSILEWLSGCSAVVLNLEGIFHKASFPAWTTQYQRSRILDALDPIRDGRRTRVLLSVANNHAADWGETPLKRTWRKIEEAGLFPMGFREKDVVLLDERLRIVVGTQWSNKKNNPWVVELDEVEVQEARAGAIEVLYPHWGHEFELYPRPDMVSMAQKFHKRFSVILGHHSHTPQPLLVEMGGRHRVQITGFSLGNVAAYFKNPLVNNGMVVKLEVGRGKGGGWVIGSLSWTWIACDVSQHRKVIVKRVEGCPFFPGEPPVLGES